MTSRVDSTAPATVEPAENAIEDRVLINSFKEVRMNTRMLSLLMAVLFAAGVWGCGSNLDSGGSTTGAGSTLADAAPVGINNCLTCHLTGVAQTWINGVHGNPDAEPNSGLTIPSCLECHDQLGDGERVANASSGQIPTNRPVVSCESCHGGGQFHNGIAAGIPFASPDSNRCGQCHNASFPHSNRPESAGVVEDFQSSPHARSLNSAVFVAGTTDVRARCSKCHSDEGARQLLNVDGDYDFLTANLPNTLTPLSGASNIDCRTCHQPHRENLLLESASTSRSSEFNTCTNCHQLLEAASSSKIVAYHDPAANSHGALGEIITDTHFATPGNFVAGTNVNDITGYAMDFADNRACRNCHNPHNADTTVNIEWAQSRHADKTAAGAWAHYNWTEVAGAVRNDGTATSSRTSCQRCHTTRGVVKLLTETNGDTTTYVPFTDYDPNWKPEMLQCQGCHSDNLGTPRRIGPVTVDFATVGFTFPDALGSNLCLACHTGRESGDDIKADTDADGIRSFINSHYLSAGGTVYKATGYEYVGQDYANVPFYEHDLIGTPAAPGTGDGVGPCIGCHMSAPEKHSFQPIVKDEATGMITEIVSPVCAECHTGQFTLTPAVLNTEEEDFAASLEALNVQLAAKGMFFFNAHPYFYVAPNGVGGSFTNWAGVYGFASYQDAMGAAFNFNLLEHDPGAFVHNRFYTKRLIYDSIDFLDDGILNDTTGAAIDALVASADPNAVLDAATAALANAYLDGDAATAGVQRP
jgi:hypothetical protein